MILTDYFTSPKNIKWEYAKQMGVDNGVIRLPETKGFDVADYSHWESVVKEYRDFGIKPVVLEPMPNCLHDHIKAGDALRDESIDKVIKMFSIMDKMDIRIICFNFMAHIGWLRTSNNVKERGGALVTGFDIDGYVPLEKTIDADELWRNYEYFIKAVIFYAEKYGIKLALHPDDPPIEKLGGVSRIMTSYENINKAINIVNSKNLGVTMCQATYLMMGEDLYDVIPRLAERIFFIHFRNVTGNKYKFSETFHDNGSIDMAKILRLYKKCGLDVPIRVDHVPLMAGEKQDIAGYSALGRLYAMGYLKGLLQAVEGE